jgi:hypothetical protein
MGTAVQTAIGIVLGFSVILATMLLIGGFAWAMIHFGANTRDFGIGALIGIVALIAVIIVVAMRA